MTVVWRPKDMRRSTGSLLAVVVVGALLWLSSCGGESGSGSSTTQSVAPQIDIVLGIYSGVPDPTWTLTDDQATELATALASLTRVEGPAPVGGLGYHGFTIISPDGTLVAFDGTVANTASTPPYYLADPDRTIERFLLDTARTQLKPEELAEVERAVG